MNRLLLAVLLVLLTGCAGGTPIPITKETIDASGKVISKVTMEVADANVAKTISLYNAQVDIEMQNTAQNKNAGFTSEVTGVDVKEVGNKVYITTLTKVTYRPVIEKASTLPDRIPDHWAKEVLISGFKYGFYAFGVSEFAGWLGEMTSGAVRGFTVTGDNNTIQGNQNKAGRDQSIRSDYVSCASGDCGGTPEQYYNDEGKCYVDPSFTCSCSSYEEGLCQ